MFEELRETLGGVGRSISDWVDHDIKRGHRTSRMLQEIALNTSATERKYDIVTQQIPTNQNASAQPLVKFPTCPAGHVWEYRNIGVLLATSQNNGIIAVTALIDDVLPLATELSTGVFSAAKGLTMPNPIVITEGRHLSLQFALSVVSDLMIGAQLYQYKPRQIKVAGTTDEEGLEHPAQFPGSESGLNFTREVVAPAATQPEVVSEEVATNDSGTDTHDETAIGV